MALANAEDNKVWGKLTSYIIDHRLDKIQQLPWDNCNVCWTTYPLNHASRVAAQYASLATFQFLLSRDARQSSCKRRMFQSGGWLTRGSMESTVCGCKIWQPYNS